MALCNDLRDASTFRVSLPVFWIGLLDGSDTLVFSVAQSHAHWRLFA
jgi:hypothetical protein